MMSSSIRTGFSFGFTSAVITTLGLMVGLSAGTNSRMAVLGGIITIAIADGFSDALGIHVSEESEAVHTTREIWQSTIITFLSKFIFAMTFALIVFLLPLKTAVLVSILYSVILLTLFSFFLAKQQETNAWKVIGEHLLIALSVILITHITGVYISTFD